MPRPRSWWAGSSSARDDHANAHGLNYSCTVSQATVCKCFAIAGSRSALYFRPTGELLKSAVQTVRAVNSRPAATETGMAPAVRAVRAP